jgi:dimethylargininase
MLALTHVPSPRMSQCQRTFVSHASVDYDGAVQQHREYCNALQQCGLTMRTLDVNRELPDCAFIEDTAIVLDELAVLASMGVESRRGEPDGILPELSRHREVHRIEPPAMIEGGDVLQINRALLVGLSGRTNRAGVEAVKAIVHRCGYQVRSVSVQGCLHLKTACTALPDGRLLINPRWLDLDGLSGFELVHVPEEEPWAANVLLAAGRVWMAANHCRTANKVRQLGFEVELLDVSEFVNAEGGVTCLSIIFES